MFPGLSALAESIARPDFLEDREKDVRLYSLLVCLEVLAIVRASAANMGNGHHCWGIRLPLATASYIDRMPWFAS
jgi:hypothetical protein